MVASPKGGEAPLAPDSIKAFEKDASSMKFYKEQKDLWTNTMPLADALAQADQFDAVFYVGGHGRTYPAFQSRSLLKDGRLSDLVLSAMFDLTNDPNSIALIEKFDAAKKPIASVCHGPAVLLQAKTAAGQPLIQDVEVTGLSNAEEDALGTSSLMPFMLETELAKVSGRYVKTEPFGKKVVVSPSTGNRTAIITGQNPASGVGVGEEILKALSL